LTADVSAGDDRPVRIPRTGRRIASTCPSLAKLERRFTDRANAEDIIRKVLLR
jgi:hypothetical protein